jgi:DNA-binding MarR family transcriptional regulator
VRRMLDFVANMCYIYPLLSNSTIELLYGGEYEKVTNSASGNDTERQPGVDHTPLEVSRATRRLDMALAGMHLEMSGRMEMTSAELLAVAYLGMEGGLGPTELARRLHMRTGAVTALLDRLEERGHIAREPHPSDRRKLVVRLTKHGRDEAMAHLRPMMAEVLELSRRLSADDRRTVGRFIDDMAEMVTRYSRPQPPKP